MENPALYRVARDICHEFGMDWYDPRTGKKHPAPKKPTHCTECGSAKVHAKGLCNKHYKRRRK
jgi:hypothetical protein